MKLNFIIYSAYDCNHFILYFFLRPENYQKKINKRVCEREKGREKEWVSATGTRTTTKNIRRLRNNNEYFDNFNYVKETNFMNFTRKVYFTINFNNFQFSTNWRKVRKQNHKYLFNFSVHIQKLEYIERIQNYQASLSYKKSNFSNSICWWITYVRDAFWF